MIPTEPYAFLLETDLPEKVTAIRHALTSGSIPYDTGMQSAYPARVIFLVPNRLLDAARTCIAPYIDEDDLDEHEDDDVSPALRTEYEVTAFPWGPIQAVFGLFLLHLGLALWPAGPWAPQADLLRMGALVPRDVLEEPWRLLTAMFLHVDPRHAFWNGVSLLVFAVPLVTYRGYAPTALVYLVSGVGGGVAAVLFSRPEATIVGSSGAVAGLFGAWIVVTLARAGAQTLKGRARVRTLGVALLFLPSLLSPITSQGHPISVSSHLGGLLTGMIIGALISHRLLKREAAGG